MWKLLVVVLLAGCATKADNVSLQGPARTTPTTVVAATSTTVGVPVEVARWSGNSDTDTENFTVTETWELHWKVSGSGAGALVTWSVPGEGFPSDYLQLPAGEGSSVVREGGTFYLQISTFMAAYEIWVVDVPN